MLVAVWFTLSVVLSMEDILGMQVVELTACQELLIGREDLNCATQTRIEASDSAHYVNAVNLTINRLGDGGADNGCLVRTRATLGITRRNIPSSGGDDLIAMGLAIAHYNPVCHSTAHTFGHSNTDAVMDRDRARLFPFPKQAGLATDAR